MIFLLNLTLPQHKGFPAKLIRQTSVINARHELYETDENIDMDDAANGDTANIRYRGTTFLASKLI